MADISRRTAIGLVASAPLLLAAAPRTMIARAIPSSKEQLPAIGLGTWQTFDVSPASYAPLEQVLRRFVELGGKVIDSSPMYGRSETAAGDVAAKIGVHKDLFIATKVWTTGREAGIRQMNASMNALRASRVDLMQVHNLVDVGTHLATLRAWRDEGRIRYVGITHYTSGAYDQVERLLRRESFDFLQINYSVTEREAEQRILPLARERGVAVLVNRPFASGALFGRVRDKALPAWAADIGVKSWAQLFLKFVLSHPAVTVAIPATAKLHHLEDNMAAGTGALPDAKQRERIAELARTL
ncbi:MAG TPA: aldo/keto reductase [Thermoanaerobaculia bacterium]|jgi:diketogulonate reductase-like aldo/keto reductase